MIVKILLVLVIAHAIGLTVRSLASIKAKVFPLFFVYSQGVLLSLCTTAFFLKNLSVLNVANKYLDEKTPEKIKGFVSYICSFTNDELLTSFYILLGVGFLATILTVVRFISLKTVFSIFSVYLYSLFLNTQQNDYRTLTYTAVILYILSLIIVSVIRKNKKITKEQKDYDNSKKYDNARLEKSDALKRFLASDENTKTVEKQETVGTIINDKERGFKC